MNPIIMLTLLLSIIFFVYSLNKYYFTRRINAINEKIFGEFCESKSDSFNEKCIIELKKDIEQVLEREIKKGQVDVLTLSNADNHEIGVSYELRYIISKAIISFDLVKKQPERLLNV